MLAVRGVWMAAVLAGGPRARAQSRRRRRAVELRGGAATTSTHHSRRRRPAGDATDLRIHRARSLDGQITIRERIPVTTPARTILDLAATLNRRALERVLDQAEVSAAHRRPTPSPPARAPPGHPGAEPLRDSPDRPRARHDAHAQSGLEERFLAFVATPASRRRCATTPWQGDTVDFVFPESAPRSSRPTAGAGTALARSSRATAGATRPTPPPAGARCASRTTASPTTPARSRRSWARCSPPTRSPDHRRRPARPPRTGRPGTPRLRRRGSGAPRRGTPAARRGPRPRGSGPPGGRPRRTPCARRGTAARAW